MLPVATKVGAGVGEGVGVAVWLGFGVPAGADGVALGLTSELAHPARLAMTRKLASAKRKVAADLLFRRHNVNVPTLVADVFR
jgi:hypothetical protein